MENRHKPLHDLVDRGGGLPGKTASEGGKKMTEVLRKARTGELDTKKAGLSLGEKSPGEQLRAAQKKRQLEALEKRRGGKQ